MKKNKVQSSLHSITFYIPANRVDIFTEALKQVSKEVYGADKRMISKYIRELICNDLNKHGYLDMDMNPLDG